MLVSVRVQRREYHYSRTGVQEPGVAEDLPYPHQDCPVTEVLPVGCLHMCPAASTFAF